MGFNSFMPSTANLYPELVQKILMSGKEGIYAMANEHQEKLSGELSKLINIGNYLIVNFQVFII